jgi:hypothetical protein
VRHHLLGTALDHSMRVNGPPSTPCT